MRTRKLLSDITASGVRMLVQILHGIVIIPVLTKLLGPASYGLWVSILAVLSMVKAVGGVHMKGALIRYQNQETRDGQTFVETGVITVVAAVATAAIFFVAAQRFTLFPGTGASADLVAPVTVLILSYIVTNLVINYPRARGEVKQFELARLAKFLLQTVLLTAVFWSTRSIVAGVWTLVGISLAIDVVILLKYAPRSVAAPSLDRLASYLRYSVPMVPRDVGNRLLSNADKYMILYFLSPTAVSIYAVSYAVANLIQLFTGVLQPTLYPTITSEWDDGNRDGIRTLYSQIYRWYTVVAVPAVAGIAILAYPVLRLLSTPEIARDGRLVVAALAVGFFVYGYNKPLTYIINAAEENEKLSKITIAAAVANVALNVVLLPTVGVFGAVVATIVSQSMTTAYVVAQARSLVAFEFPTRTFARAVAATLAMTAALLAVPVDLPWTWRLAAFPVGGVVVYLAAFTLVGGLDREDVRNAIRLVTEDRSIE